MARFLLSLRVNMAYWPLHDTQKILEQNEKMWAFLEDLMKKGLVKDFGIFSDGETGFLICEGAATDVYMVANTFLPYTSSEVHEIIPYEKQKEIFRAVCKAAIADRKK